MSSMMSHKVGVKSRLSDSFASFVEVEMVASNELYKIPPSPILLFLATLLSPEILFLLVKIKLSMFVRGLTHGKTDLAKTWL